MIEYNGKCNQKIQNTFKHLDTLLIVMLAFLGIVAGIFVMNTIISADSLDYPELQYVYSMNLPPYVGIISIILFIIVCFVIMYIKDLRNHICKNDGKTYTLF